MKKGEKTKTKAGERKERERNKKVIKKKERILTHSPN